ncbi:cupin domain-containing protein [soil metagenome]
MPESERFVVGGSQSVDVPSTVLSGQAWLDHLGSGVAPSRLRLVRVQLAPGSRTVWHSHQYGQILHVIDGIALTQERGGAVSRHSAGDTIVCAPGIWHWHGSAPDRFMTHIAVHEVQDDGTDATWGEHVTDEEYSA